MNDFIARKPILNSKAQIYAYRIVFGESPRIAAATPPPISKATGKSRPRSLRILQPGCPRTGRF